MTLLKDIRNVLTRLSIDHTSMLVAVSGGIDSIAMVHALVELKPKFNLELSIAHLDHCIRGEASAETAEFVRSVAGELDLEARIEKRPVPRVAEKESKSLEEAARSVRYSFLTEVARAKDSTVDL